MLEDVNVIDFLIARNEIIYVPDKVMNELNNHIYGKFDEKSSNATKAKDLIQKNEKHIRRTSEAGVNADSSIQQIILANMGIKEIDRINVYAYDQGLAKMCRAQNNNPTIKHKCRIEVYKYFKKYGESLTPEECEPEDNLIRKFDGGELWRNEFMVSSFDSDSTWIMKDYQTEQGHIDLNVIKYWAHNAKAWDYYKLYKRINLHKGDVVKVDIITYNNSCDVRARLCAYSTITGKPCDNGKAYVSLTANRWRTFILRIDDDYDYINIEFIPFLDSSANKEWDGFDGFINCFHVERHNSKKS